MIPILGFFYILMVGEGQAAVAGPFADYESCVNNSTYVEYLYGQANRPDDGYGVASVCYATVVPDADTTTEMTMGDRT